MFKNYWPLVVFFLVLLGIVGMSQYADHSKREYEKAYAQINSTSIAEGKDGKPRDHGTEPYKSPIWAKYVTFPEGLGAWAVVLTLFAIVWQSIETRRSAEATERSVNLSREQIEMNRQSQRARIEIEPSGNLFLDESQSPDFWYFHGSVRIRNIGASRAFINIFQLSIDQCDAGKKPPRPDFSDRFNMLSEKYIDPAGDEDEPLIKGVSYVDTERIDKTWFASALFEQKVYVYISGLLEYETAGTTYERKFAFKYEGYKGGFLSVIYDATKVETNADKFSHGSWKVLANQERVITQKNED